MAALSRFIIAASLLAGTAALSGCSYPVDCSGGNYRGGCVPGVAGSPDMAPGYAPAGAQPAVVAPAGAAPGPAVTPPAAAGPIATGRGDPALFADVDDRQCRSYGLAFGSRDYADCRIRLSAQHRGLDPNAGVGPPTR